jgi:hypothetical protein
MKTAFVLALAMTAVATGARAETTTPVTMERVEGPIHEVEVFAEDGFYHAALQDVTVTVRTVEGRPLTDQEKAESRVIAATCPSGADAYNIFESETADGAYVVAFTCE